VLSRIFFELLRSVLKYLLTASYPVRPFRTVDPPQMMGCFVLSIAAMLSLTLEFCGVRTLPGRWTAMTLLDVLNPAMAAIWSQVMVSKQSL